VSGPIDHGEFASVCRQEIGSNPRLGNTAVELGLKPSDLLGVFEQVSGLYDRFVTFPHVDFAAAEIKLEVDAAVGLTLIGQVDAVFGQGDAVRLVDWKTGALGEAEGQLMFYALLWAMDREHLPSLVEAVSVTTGERFSAEPSSTSIGAIAVEVEKMVDSLRSAWSTGVDLERRGGPWCEYCPILADCSEGQATVEILAN
jgi:PD-(D/E)XK nuclease superfamily